MIRSLSTVLVFRCSSFVSRPQLLVPSLCPSSPTYRLQHSQPLAIAPHTTHSRLAWRSQSRLRGRFVPHSATESTLSSPSSVTDSLPPSDFGSRSLPSLFNYGPTRNPLYTPPTSPPPPPQNTPEPSPPNTVRTRVHMSHTSMPLFTGEPEDQMQPDDFLRRFRTEIVRATLEAEG